MSFNEFQSVFFGFDMCRLRRLVDIITEKLLSLKEAFSRLDPAELAERLEPPLVVCISCQGLCEVSGQCN